MSTTLPKTSPPARRSGGDRAIRLVCVDPDLDESDLDPALAEIENMAAEL